tara:strand:- start:646 stop:1617 length:972 start_codon:yes stop_codon:yes gene_type:complete
MAVSVNTVYTTVLYILNKEQRGYVTPTEFNSIAAQVQLEIFNSYFPDGNQLNRFNQNNTQNDTEYFNVFKDIRYKIYPFEGPILFTLDTSINAYFPTNRNTVFKIGEVISNYSGQPSYNSITDYVTVKDFNKIKRSKLTAPTKAHPIYTTSNSTVQPLSSTADTTAPIAASLTAVLNNFSGNIPRQGEAVTGTGVLANTSVASFNLATNTVTFSSAQTIAAGVTLTFTPSAYNDLILNIDPIPTSVSISGLRRPINPNWAFSTGQLGQYNFNPGSAVNFELDISEQSNIITKVLKYFGIIINDPTIIQTSIQESQAVEVNEKS